MRRRDLIVLVGGVAAWPLAAHPQQATIPVIGFLHSLSADRSTAVLAAFHQGLRDAGYVVGQNVSIEYRWGEGHYDRLSILAADLVKLKVDLIVTGGGTEPILAAKRATSTIPIVFALATDPVGDGLVASLARPGGNVTGVSVIGLDLLPKRLELLFELLPAARVFGLLVNPNVVHSERQIAVAQGAAKTKGVQLHILKARTQAEIDAAFQQLAELHTDALVVGDDAFFYNQRDQFAVLAARYSLPAIYGLDGHVAAGGLISYGPSLVGAYRQSASFATRVLAGAKPADLPVQQPTTFQLSINLRAAKALDNMVPPSLLARADEVIE